MNRRDALKQTALMLGYAVSASAVAGVMAGCQASEVDNWQPAFLNKDQGKLVAEMAERILPATDTPGAKDVGVHAFIDSMLQDHLSEEEITNFMAGIPKVDAAAKELFNKPFVSLEDSQKDEVLNRLVAEGEGNPKDFFNQMRQLTVLGYFT
ncbi:MAG: gluconate 2-dehydrogenase subunit 3 family protein, partial [Bacteroidota bacterium]